LGGEKQKKNSPCGKKWEPCKPNPRLPSEPAKQKRIVAEPKWWKYPTDKGSDPKNYLGSGARLRKEKDQNKKSIIFSVKTQRQLWKKNEKEIARVFSQGGMGKFDVFTQR